MVDMISSSDKAWGNSRLANFLLFEKLLCYATKRAEAEVVFLNSVQTRESSVGRIYHTAVKETGAVLERENTPATFTST